MREITCGAFSETLFNVDKLFSCQVMGRHGLSEHSFITFIFILLDFTHLLSRVSDLPPLFIYI